MERVGRRREKEWGEEERKSGEKKRERVGRRREGKG